MSGDAAHEQSLQTMYLIQIRCYFELPENWSARILAIENSYLSRERRRRKRHLVKVFTDRLSRLSLFLMTPLVATRKSMHHVKMFVSRIQKRRPLENQSFGHIVPTKICHNAAKEI